MNTFSKTLNAIGLSVFLLIFVLSAWYFQQHVQQIIISIKQLGFLAPIGFVVIYCLSTLMLLPTMVLTLASGAIFGPLEGTVLNLAGASLGASLAFLISRYLAADWVRQRRGPRLQQLMAAVERHGWQSVALLRLFPILPFNLVNYGMGITAIRFRVYVLTTLVFLLPPEILYTYFGYAGVHILFKPERLLSTGGIVLLILASALLFLIAFIHRRHRGEGQILSLDKEDDFQKNHIVQND